MFFVVSIEEINPLHCFKQTANYAICMPSAVNQTATFKGQCQLNLMKIQQSVE